MQVTTLPMCGLCAISRHFIPIAVHSSGTKRCAIVQCQALFGAFVKSN